MKKLFLFIKKYHTITNIFRLKVILFFARNGII